MPERQEPKENRMNSNDGESKSDGGRNVGADATGNA